MSEAPARTRIVRAADVRGMRAILVLLALGVAVAGCLLEPDESTPTGDEGIGSGGAEGTGSEGEITSCPTVAGNASANCTPPTSI